MEAVQEWCLQCGTAAPGSLGTHSRGWRSSAIILGLTAILVVGAATAAYAALTKTNAAPRRVTVAQVPAATTPVAPTTVAPTTTPTVPSTTTTPKPVLPATTVKPPKIPLTAATPKSTATTPATTPTTATPKATTPPKKTATTPKATTPPAEQLPTTSAILLDTNAVTTYNPENYPVATFGDPTLAIDGDTSTAWSAQVDPAIAPKMAVGLLIDLNTPQKLSELELITSTPGMTVEVFGANGSSAPTTITNPAWTHLSPYQVENKKHLLIKLGNSTKAFRFVTLWISGAPAASIGTPTAPGLVEVNEVELYPPK